MRSMQKILAGLTVGIGFVAALGAIGPDDTPAEAYAERRAALLESIESGIVLIWGERQDAVRGFRQSNDLLYLTGIDFPGAALLMVAKGGDGEDSEILFVPSQTDTQARWVGKHLHPGSSDEEKKAAGFKEVRDIESLGSALRRSVQNRQDRAVDLWMSFREGEPGSPPSADLLRVEDVRNQFPQARVRPLRYVLTRLRQVKDESERGHLREAVAATRRGLVDAMAAVRPGMSEMELRSIVEAGFLRAGASGIGFASIVGSGPNSTVLHYPAGFREMKAGEVVLMDVGAEVAAGYTADVTRTVPVSGTFTPRQKEIYELVLGAQEAGFEAATKEGATLASVHDASKKFLEDAGYGEAFWHYTGHWLGLDVHDVGERSRPLEPGMVFTVEPGIYLPDEGFGVRIEDDVLITESGIEVLSADIPRTVKELERAMRR